MSWFLRAVREDDWRAVKALRLSALKKAPEAFLTRFEDEASRPDSFWQARNAGNVQGTSSACFLAFEGQDSEPGPAIGMAVGLLAPEDPQRALLAAMWLEAPWRAQGIAPALVEAVASWAFTRGAEKLEAEVRRVNERALSFYQRLGFELLETPEGKDHRLRRDL